ncbi:MAG: hypothetical protein WBL24_03290 [Kiritimatiellia bacterium]|jgi:L-lactate utilization protein LutB
MKTKMIILLTAATLTVSLALAQGGGPRQAQGSRKGQQTRDRQRDPAACASYCPQADTCPKAAWGAGQGQKKGGPMSPEMRGQMRAEHRAIRNLGRAACAETDPAKKEELIAQLRAKILEVDDRMQTHREERLAAAEAQLTQLQQQVRDAKRDRERRADEQVQRILSGERPAQPDAFRQRPRAKQDQGRGLPPPPQE